jgi:Zn-dependent M28 family amino/carboxypeptidase
VWFAFFDGEEAMVSYGPEDGLWGSKFFVEQLKADDKLKDVKAMVLLDMVGDASLNITVPPNGSSELTEKLFEAARQTGNRDYFSYRQTQILDDHVPFLEAGVPALDIIDFEFGSAPGLNDYWHTEKDSLEHIRPRSLEIVGQTTLRLITLIRNSFVTH